MLLIINHVEKNESFLCKIYEDVSARQWLLEYWQSLPIPLFVLSKRHPHSPNALCNPGPHHWQEADPESPPPSPGNWSGCRWSAGCELRTRPCACIGSSSWSDPYGFTRSTSISSRTTVTPLSYIHPTILHPTALQWHEWA